MNKLKTQFSREIIDILDKEFPKNKCKERGQALMLVAQSSIIFNRIIDEINNKKYAK